MDFENLANHFPFAEIRQQQLEVINLIRSNPNKKHYIMECPTGVGKSGIALALANASKDAFIATANKSLQDQYENEFPDILTTIKGRDNYLCTTHSNSSQGVKFTCANSPCQTSKQAKQDCSKLRLCEYHGQLTKAKQSHSTLFNFAAFLTFTNHTPHFKPRESLIFDEAHNLVSWLTNFIQITFSIDKIRQQFSIHTPLSYVNGEDYEHYLRKLEEAYSARKTLLEELEPLDKQQLKELEHIESQLHKLNMIFNSKLGLNNFAVVEEKSKFGHQLHFKPIDVSEFTKDYIFNKAEKFFYLSATILNFDEFISQLGINPNDCVKIQVGSSFPKQNRPIIKRYVGQLNYKTTPTLLPKLIEEIKSILQEHKDHRGIIHGISYTLCDQIMSGVDDPRIIFPRTAAAQEQAKITHKSSPNSVLLSPSMFEGVDLKQDLARFQIIVKMPFPNIKDRVLMRRKELYPDYIYTQTALALVQAYGRIIRSETDWGKTYILDGGFDNFRWKRESLLPKYFIEAIENDYIC